ncbi:MAG: bifunctional glutamate N-acetyltransferase/amino-acid acetyltransferase ArgJ [Chloroflexota bacterium]|nr:bifunctional glutamate N-acetyltransferase/amino-acid acetyltransferase ArgJ [Chloroflexota bacterium]
MTQTKTVIGAEPTIAGVSGFKAAGVHCGYKKDGALDFALIYSEKPCIAAGVFTRNVVKAAPVLLDMERLAANTTHIRAVVINTRCANACTGEQGLENARTMARWTAERLGIAEDEVLVMSTGVIGTQLDMDKIRRGVDLSVAALADGAAAWENAAHAIMTTDTRAKLASARGGADYTVAGIAKGAGMIAPNMATMLGIVVTDAALEPEWAVGTLRAVNETTFNRIVVDGDTSTNDTLLLLANGHETDAAGFEEALRPVCKQLAQAIVRDGEGATKFITLNISGAGDDATARLIGNTIATSPLVKTAFYGGDANWGRIVAAAGRAGVPLVDTALKLWLAPGEDVPLDANALLLFEHGMPTTYSETRATEIMASPSVTVWLDCGIQSAGEDALPATDVTTHPQAGAATIWTCDLSHDYVSVNGHYRT